MVSRVSEFSPVRDGFPNGFSSPRSISRQPWSDERRSSRIGIRSYVKVGVLLSPFSRVLVGGGWEGGAITCEYNTNQTPPFPRVRDRGCLIVRLPAATVCEIIRSKKRDAFRTGVLNAGGPFADGNHVKRARGTRFFFFLSFLLANRVSRPHGTP